MVNLAEQDHCRPSSEWDGAFGPQNGPIDPRQMDGECAQWRCGGECGNRVVGGSVADVSSARSLESGERVEQFTRAGRRSPYGNA